VLCALTNRDTAWICYCWKNGRYFYKTHLVTLAVTLPATSDKCERSFSKMKLLKTIPRNSMTSERLGNIDLLSVERYSTSWKIDLDEFVSRVSRVWQAWFVPWAPLWRGRKNCLAKIKICDLQILQPLFCAPYR